MSPTPRMTRVIDERKNAYEELRVGKESLLRVLYEAEAAEAVFNSNAIENSTLTLQDTEKILLAGEVAKGMDLREIFGAQNLYRVTGYLFEHHGELELDESSICLLHKMLLSNINEDVAGRFRQFGEYVRVGPHVAPAPETITGRLQELVVIYHSGVSTHFVDRLAKFHLGFEHLHPFVDGNGRIGRVLTNLQLIQSGFPPVIVRNDEKTAYFGALREYDRTGSIAQLSKLFGLYLAESLAKRIAYLRGATIVRIGEFAAASAMSVPRLIGLAKRQSIPAFRERGYWCIAADEQLSQT